jgi:hypothetical protein
MKLGENFAKQRAKQQQREDDETLREATKKLCLFHATLWYGHLTPRERAYGGRPPAALKTLLKAKIKNVAPSLKDTEELLRKAARAFRGDPAELKDAANSFTNVDVTVCDLCRMMAAEQT